MLTAETSNLTYSDIAGAPAGTVTQMLQQPVSCAIDNLFEEDKVPLGEMKQLRDLQIAKYRRGSGSSRFSIAIPPILP